MIKILPVGKLSNTCSPVHFQAEGIDTRQGLLHCAGDAGRYAELLLRFAAKQRIITRKIRDAVSENEFTSAALLTHTLLQLAGDVGAVQAIPLLLHTESCLQREQDDIYLFSVLDDLVACLDRIAVGIECESQLNDWIRMQTGREELPVDGAINRLLCLLQESDLEAVDCFAQIHLVLRTRMEPTVYSSLEQAIARYALLEAAVILESGLDRQEE